MARKTSNTKGKIVDAAWKLFYEQGFEDTTVENRIDLDLLTRMYSAQLTAKGEKQLLDHNRVYYKLLRKIMARGQERGEITTEKTVSELVRFYAFCERSMLYDWCLYGGEYSLREYAKYTMPQLLSGIRA